MKNLTHGSLFSGIGGFDLGAEQSGIPTIWNCEQNAECRKVLNKHFPSTEQFTDIIELHNPPYVDIISGGFPCQDISIANVSNKKVWSNEKQPTGIYGERSGLWSEMWRIIGQVRPKYVLIENSPMLIVRGLEQVLCDLSKSGYYAEWQCLPATKFGYCHKRERIYIIAYTEQIGCKSNNSVFRKLPKIFSKETPRQSDLPFPFKRFNSNSDYSHVRMYDEFSKELDKTAIEMLGNAVIPSIAHYLFECIKVHYNEISL